jgi:hypothetical protein
MTQLLERKPRTLVLDGEVIEVRVRESNKARTSRIIVGPKRPLEIIVPHGVSDAEVDRILGERRSWIRAKTARASEIADRIPQLGLDQAGVVWLDLEPVPVDIIQTTAFDAGPLRAQLRDGRLVVGNVSFSSSEDEVTRAIDRWYRREARHMVTEVAEREAARLRLSYLAIAIRDQRTRWGSCSLRGNLSFNWRLAIAPREVREYVVVHELLHLREPNHSRAFWRLLDAAMPGWPEQARWLRENGHELHGFAPVSVIDLS